jgi:UDP-N-acetylglucosamine pyrophosphorylase
LDDEDKGFYQKYFISIFIITSHRDNGNVYEFLENNKFFYFENLNVCFQNDLTVIDSKGKIIKKDKTSILKCPNGTGGVFQTFHQYRLGTQ